MSKARTGVRWRAVLGVAAVIGLEGAALAGAAAAEDKTPAKILFGQVVQPSPGASRPIGSYARGCIAGAQQLPSDGPTWQAMRLSRNRTWGDPKLIAYIERLANDVSREGWPGLLIGDMSQPRGGPMATGHASHQIGLDVDLWLIAMPDKRLDADEREKMSAISVLRGGKLELDPAKWHPEMATLIRRAVSYPEVERVFVSPAIKQHLCETAGFNRGWLRKVRPWWGHDDHIHVRLACPPGLAGCANQAAPADGDGCGAELADWFKPRPPPTKPTKPPPEITLADLPAACTGVLSEPAAALPATRAAMPAKADGKPAN